MELDLWTQSLVTAMTALWTKVANFIPNLFGALVLVLLLAFLGNLRAALVVALMLPLAALVALLCVPIFVTDRRISRTEGALFVTAYAVYLGTLIFVRA